MYFSIDISHAQDNDFLLLILVFWIVSEWYCSLKLMQYTGQTIKKQTGNFSQLLFRPWPALGGGGFGKNQQDS